MRISDWSSDVCSSDLNVRRAEHRHAAQAQFGVASVMSHDADDTDLSARIAVQRTNQDVGPIGIPQEQRLAQSDRRCLARGQRHRAFAVRSEEHTSELQSLMRISYAVFCLKKKKTTHTLTL